MRRPSRTERPLTILLVRPRLIGDVLLTTPLVRALRQRFPDARLLYLVESLAAPVVLANPHVDETIEIRHRRGWRRVVEDLSLAARLARRRIDVAIDLHGGPRSGWLTFATRARKRVGYDVSGRQWMYTDLVPKPRGYAPRHSVRNQWDLLVPIDPAFDRTPEPAVDRLEMPVAETARANIAARLTTLGVPLDARVIVMHVAAGNEFRRWPEASFAAVAAALVRADRRRVVLAVGSAGEAESVERVVGEAQSHAGDAVSRIVAAAGWPLADLRALMERAALFVGGDSGPMHIAAASDIPIVAIFGPTMPVTWAPWRPDHLPVEFVEPGPLSCRPCDQRVCEPGDFRCLRRTDAARVIASVEALLERAS
jgi:lipopolysaccharide heptosyltransferase II